MSKTPEEMAEEYADLCVSDAYYAPLKAGFLAGYQAAKDQIADDVEIIAKRKIISLAEAKELFPHGTDQLADASKVMPLAEPSKEEK